MPRSSEIRRRSIPLDTRASSAKRRIARETQCRRSERWKLSDRHAIGEQRSVAYFTAILRALGVEAVDEGRLREILDRKLASPVVNMNVGRNSRSARQFSDETKAMLEDFLSHHFGPLDELLEELPWRKEASIAP